VIEELGKVLSIESNTTISCMLINNHA